MSIKNFTIFGERNSGTTYLKNLLEQMLCISFTQEYGFKHWYIKDFYPRGINNTTTDNECLKSLDNSDDTLFIIIVRNVYDWVGSMYKKPWHIQNLNKNSIYEFISNKYICYLESCPYDHNYFSKTPYYINYSHKYPYFIEEADNLIKLRNLKNNHFYNLKNKVKNFYIIRQEHLQSDIKDMIKIFNLNYKFLELKNYKTPSSYNLDNHIDRLKYN